MENSRYAVDMVGDEPGSSEGTDNSWMLSYLDVLTLLIAFFVLLLAMSEPKTDDDDIPAEIAQTGSAGSAAGSTTQTPLDETGGVMPGGIGVLPEYNSLLEGTSGETTPDAEDEGSDADQDARLESLENSLDALSLQGVDAQPGREGLTLRIADNLLFASGQAELMYEGMMLISQLTGFLNAFEGEISIEGHTDNIPINTPQFPSNWELSSDRAISVLRFLEFDGISATRMRAVGYADTRPLQPNDTPQNRAGNRRVELVLREP
ncbi:MAG: flagellar motor protein MotB [Pseudohongiella sp.]|uniref:flagellar motor protein MotB n=1 Tax=Pseudohongiella sp. TaxID=1979412 RepID=UPI0034A00313